MHCTKHPNHEASAVCFFSGRPYCAAELVEVQGRWVAKDNLDQFVNSLNQLSARTSNTDAWDILNAGGGGGTSRAIPAPKVRNMTPPPEPVGRSAGRRSRSTAVLLALLLGGIGAHKFYLGRWRQGLLYLAFFWTLIPAVLSLFEGRQLLEMSDADFAVKFG